MSRREFVSASLAAVVFSRNRTVRPAAGSPVRAAPPGDRPRVVVSSDIGGTDPDDFQSMVHLLVHADELDLEGLVSSPYGPGRKRHILDVIDRYETDYPNLSTYSRAYPALAALRAVTKQGGIDDLAPDEDVERAWIVAPEILPKLRVYYIGGPNKKWSVDAYHYVATHHPRLWIIEANSTYRGWFVGGDQEGDRDNTTFVTRYVAGRGALGDFFAQKLGGTIKMGDSPSVGWLLRGTPGEPSLPGWGGRFVRAWERPYAVFPRLTSEADRIEEFGVLELRLPVGASLPDRPEATMVIENQERKGYFAPDDTVRFRFSPKDAKAYRYVLRSNVPAPEGGTGGLTAVAPEPSAALRPSPRWPNWWTDDPAPYAAEGPHRGARTVSEWREDFLRDFTDRMRRCAEPASAGDHAAGTPVPSPRTCSTSNPSPATCPDSVPRSP